MSDVAVDVRNVVKKYRGRGGVHALKGVSFQVARGEIFGLLGRNGAGKTTLVKILLDIVRASGGEARLNGKSSRLVDGRRSVGYLPEDHKFPQYQRASASLAYYARLSGMSESAIAKRSPELLELVGLSRAAHQKVRSFSKGMKQRLGLAQAMMTDPEILFLDEPTDGVDPVGRKEIRDVLFALKDQGKTIFLNSHLLSEVEELCGRVAILELGELKRIGSVSEMTSGGDSWAVRCAAPIAEALRSEIEKLASGPVRASEELLEFSLANEGDIDAIVDLLRGSGIGIRELHHKVESLESVFIDLVQGQRTAGAA